MNFIARVKQSRVVAKAPIYSDLVREDPRAGRIELLGLWQASQQDPTSLDAVGSALRDRLSASIDMYVTNQSRNTIQDPPTLLAGDCPVVSK